MASHSLPGRQSTLDAALMPLHWPARIASYRKLGVTETFAPPRPG